MISLAPDLRTAAIAREPWKRLSNRALGRSRHVPTMLSEQEQKLYFWLTAFWADGAGAVVDLGCFAGGSTARLAEGLAVAGHSTHLHAFDRFTTDEKTKRSVLYAQGVPAFQGRSIYSLSQAHLAPWKSRVSLHRGEIDHTAWDNGAIEILVVDAGKSARTMDRMAETFLPHLIPGRSLLIHQDFLHWNQPWIAAQMEMLAKFFVPVAHVPRDTIVFECQRAPQAPDISEARTESLSDARLTSLILKSRRRFLKWRLADRFLDIQRSIARNPGCRRAFQFQRPDRAAVSSISEPR